jgi:glycosyltransferase involved in cell wall biosynthesis
LSKQLVERGHRVTILAAGFSHYKFREEHLRAGESWREEDCNGVRFIWLKTFPYSKNDWRRVLNMASYAWRAFWRCSRLRETPDAIVGVSVHPLAALAGWAASVVRRSRFFIELTDLWPEVLIDFGMLSRRNPIAWFLRALEKFLYRRAERIIMIWPRTGEYVKRLGVSPGKVVWIPHLADISRYESLKPYDGRIGRCFTVMYLGSFASSTAMDVILQAAKLLQDRGRRDIRFVLMGGGTDRDHLRELTTQLGLGNVEFPGLVPKKDIVKVMGDADAFVLSLKDAPLLKYGVSLNKVCDYLASGRPTILAGNPGYDPIQQANAGLSVQAENPKALADAIELLITLPAGQRVQMGINGREYLGRVHGITVLADRLEKILLGAVPGDAASGDAPIPRDKSKGHPVYETRI